MLRTPHERLLCAVIVLAWKDAHGRDEELKAAALAWLRSEDCTDACEWLGLDVGRLLSRLDDLGTP